MSKKPARKILPPVWSTIILCTYSKLRMHWKYNIHIDRRVLRRQKRGCLIIYNHFSNRDHYLLSAATNYRRITFVLTSYYFFNPKLAKVLKIHRTIKKDQFRPDISAIRQIKKVVECGGKVALAPAGQVSLTGESPYINPAIVKLVKMCNCDVIALQMRGTHLTFPKWRKTERKCDIDLKFVNVITKEELALLDDTSIHKRIMDSINVNEYTDQLTLARPIKCKSLPAGLEDVFIKCPKCKTYYTITTNLNLIKCNHCGNTVLMDKYGSFQPVENDVCFKNEIEWYNWQKEQLKIDYLKPNFHLESMVNFVSNPHEPFKRELVGTGKLTLTREQLIFEGTYLGEPYVKEFSHDHLVQLPFAPNSHFEIPDDSALFRFEPYDKHHIIHWVQLVDVINELRTDNEKAS